MQRYVPSGKGDSLRISLPWKDFENPSSPKGFVDPFREGGFLWNRLLICSLVKKEISCSCKPIRGSFSPSVFHRPHLYAYIFVATLTCYQWGNRAESVMTSCRKWDSEVEVSRTQRDSKFPWMSIGGRGFVLDCLIIFFSSHVPPDVRWPLDERAHPAHATLGYRFHRSQDLQVRIAYAF